jgi:hypothetical protein
LRARRNACFIPRRTARTKRWRSGFGDAAPPPWKRDFPDICTEEDVYHCFRLLLGRPPTAAEWPGHRAQVGSDLQRTVTDYLSSREFIACGRISDG